jgi:hypothetical protein
MDSSMQKSDSATTGSVENTSLTLKDEKILLSEPGLFGIEDEFLPPTEEETATLRRVADRIPWNAYREWNLRSLQQ